MQILAFPLIFSKISSNKYQLYDNFKIPIMKILTLINRKYLTLLKVLIIQDIIVINNF
jgi:hypothetical protein